MFHAFPDRQHIDVGGHHLVIHMDALSNRQACALPKCHVGADTHGHDQQIAGQFRPVIQQQGTDLSVLAQDLLGVCGAFDGDALIRQGAAQQIACGLVQLPLHQMPHDVHNGHVDAAGRHACRRLQPQQPAADHDASTAFAQPHHPFGVFQIAVGDDAFQIVTRQRDHKGVRSGAQNQLVIGHRAVLARYRLRRPVDIQHLFAKTAGDVIFGVPSIIMGHDVGIGLLSRQDRGQHDAVVVAPCLCVEKGDVIGFAVLFQKVLQHPTRGHTGTDNDKFLFHGLTPPRLLWVSVSRRRQVISAHCRVRIPRGNRALLAGSCNSRGVRAAPCGCVDAAGLRR